MTIANLIPGNTTTNVLSFATPFNGWSFTNNFVSVPQHYVALSIQSLEMTT
jgi:hypothetical protein